MVRTPLREGLLESLLRQNSNLVTQALMTCESFVTRVTIYKILKLRGMWRIANNKFATKVSLSPMVGLQLFLAAHEVTVGLSTSGSNPGFS